MFHVFLFLQSDMIFGIVNRFREKIMPSPARTVA